MLKGVKVRGEQSRLTCCESVATPVALTHVQQLWPSSSAQQQSSSKDTPSPTLSPSASFAALGGPTDQATPRAAPTNNPFDSVGTPGLSKSTANLSLDGSKRSASPALGAGPSGLRTPTSHGFPLPLGTPGAGQATTGITVGDQMGATGGIGFGLHEPPKMRKALNRVTDSPEVGTKAIGSANESPESAGDNDQASTASSSNGSNTPVHHGSPRGTLNVKLISARGLAVSNSINSPPEPYVVMQFEQNEFVSRPPHPVTSPASVPFTTSTAQPMVSGNLTRSSSGLGVGTISRAFAEAMGRGKKKDGEGSGAQTPRAEDPAGGGGWMGKPGPGDPVWKEEVSL
jgi:protein-serine/threonine kinase